MTLHRTEDQLSAYLCRSQEVCIPGGAGQQRFFQQLWPQHRGRWLPRSGGRVDILQHEDVCVTLCRVHQGTVQQR